MDSNTIPDGIAPGHFQCFGRNVPGMNCGQGKPVGQADRYAAAACPDVQNANGDVRMIFHDPADQFFCFRAGNQNRRGYFKGESGETGFTYYIL